MQIVEPYAKMMPLPGVIQLQSEDGFTEFMGKVLLRHVEWCSRISHRSEEAVTEDSWKRIIKSVVLEHGDWSVTEHAVVSVDAYVDRGITHEWVRHRMGAYTQECISGDTLLRGRQTIKSLFDSGENGQKIRIHNGKFIVKGNVARVFNKGVQPVYSVVTDKGYRIKTTMAHEFQMPDKSYVRLEHLAIGDSVLVNGRPCLLEISDQQLKKELFKNGLSKREIAVKYGAPESTVGRRVRLLKVVPLGTRINDKNPEKYNKNHTSASYEKMRESVISGYANGRSIWNKGISEDDSSSVKKQADTLRKYHHRNGFGPQNSNWKGGCRKTSREEARRLKEDVLECEACSSVKRLEVHHVDEDPANNDEDNLIKLCHSCHKKVHSKFRIGIRPVESKIVSILFVGYERVYDLEVFGKYHNYVANGFIVHNSTRFVNYQKKMAPSFVNPFVIEQESYVASGEPVPGRSIQAEMAWKEAVDGCEQAYQEILKLNYPPQIARSVFPNALASRIIVTYNLRNWRHFLLMRTTKEAHPQMKQVTIPLLEEFKSKIPLLYEDIEPNARQVDNLKKAR